MFVEHLDTELGEGDVQRITYDSKTKAQIMVLTYTILSIYFHFFFFFFFFNRL